MKYQVLPPIPSWFVALQGHGGDKSAREPDSFTAGSFLPPSIAPREAVLWRTRWLIELLLPVCVADMNQESTLIWLRCQGGQIFIEMHRWNTTWFVLVIQSRSISSLSGYNNACELVFFHPYWCKFFKSRTWYILLSAVPGSPRQ